jgi:tetratricopeptide (TPR) repeat protein
MIFNEYPTSSPLPLLSDEDKLAAEQIQGIVRQAASCAAREEWVAARDALILAVKIAPNCPQVLGDLGIVQYRLKDYASALLNFQAAIRQDPGNVEFYTHMAQVQLRLELVDDAKRLLRHALTLNPDHVGAHQMLGDLDFAGGRVADAAKHYCAALAGAPSSVDILINLGRCYKELKDLASARRCFNRVISMEPSNTTAAGALQALSTNQTSASANPQEALSKNQLKSDPRGQYRPSTESFQHSNKKNTVIVLSTVGENDAINVIMTAIAGHCRRIGYLVEYFDMSKHNSEDSARFMATLSSGRTKFCLTYLGVGQDLEVGNAGGITRNLWEHFEVPLVKIHGDSPAHYFERHKDKPGNAINVYFCEEFIDLHEEIFGHGQCISILSDPCLIYDFSEEEIDFSARRKGTLYFLKNGADPAKLQAVWREKMPREIGRQLLSLASEVLSASLKPGKLRLQDTIKSYLASQRIDIRDDGRLLCFYIAQMDDYVRRVKANMVVQALLKCPVVIQGANWGHLDMSRAVAKVMPAQNAETNALIYRSQLGVIDMSPNMDVGCHDRMVRAAGTYSFALTNRCSWLENLFPELNDVGYSFDQEYIRGAVNDALRQPERCIELGREYGRRFRIRYRTEDFVAKLATVAEMTRLRHSLPKA